MSYYYNPYVNNPYSQFGNIQPNYYQNQQPQFQSMQQPQTTYLPFTFVNGLEGAKAFIVALNQTVYLMDADNNVLYEKKADNQGRCTLKSFALQAVDLNNVGNHLQNLKSNMDYLQYFSNLNSKLDSILEMIKPKREVNTDE